MSADRVEVFTEVYLRRMWGSEESASGTGSTLSNTRTLRKELRDLVSDLGIQVLLDAPCGDFNWMKEADLPLKKYIGLDIVSPLIESNCLLYGSEGCEFAVSDIVKDELPFSDMIFCRDCLNHLPLEDGVKAIKNFIRSGARFLVASTNSELTENSAMVLALPPLGWRRLNLELPPFSLGTPFRIIHDLNSGVYASSMGVWRLR